MASSQYRQIVPAIALLLLTGTSFHAVAATGFSACSGEKSPADAISARLVDYNSPALADDPSDLRDSPSAINASQIPLTASVDTTIRRDDAVKSDLELPIADERQLEQKPDAAALLLERRNAQLETEDDELPEVTTRFPGMNSDEMVQLRNNMYRTDI